MIPSLITRSHQPELMDAPDCREDQLLRTVRQFASINRLVSRYRSILKRWVLTDMLRDPDRAYHLVDMGAGGCDIDAWLLGAARRLRLNLRVTACDADPRIVRYARAAHESTVGLTILKRDVINDPIEEPVDFVFANHFLHHLSDRDIVTLLQRWAPRVQCRMLFSDLHRTPLAYLGFALFASFYRNSFAREDGLISIRRGFVPSELEALGSSGSRDGATEVHELHPGRLVLVMEPLSRNHTVRPDPGVVRSAGS